MDVFAVPVDQVLARDGCNGCVFGLACVRIVGSIGKFDGLALRNLTDLVIAPGDGIFFSFFGDVDLVCAELRMLQHVDEDFEDIVEIALQAGKADAGGVRTTSGFNFGRADFEKVVELIAGLRLGATGAPDVTVNVDESDLARGLVVRAPADTGRGIDQWQLMIFLQEDHHAIRELNTLGLLRFERRERRDWYFLPVRCLACNVGRRDDDDCAEKQSEEDPLHFYVHYTPLHCTPP